MVDIGRLIETSKLFSFCLHSLGVLVVAKIIWGFIYNVLEKEMDTNRGAWVQGYTMEELVIIVRRNLVCPFVQEIGTDEQGNLFFQCEGVRFGAKMKGGRLFVVQKNIFGMESQQLSEKGWELQQCICELFSENPELDKKRMDRDIQVLAWGNVANWVMGAAVFLCAAYVIFQVIGGMDTIKSRGISTLCLTDYSKEYTINDALRASCTDGEWTSSKKGDITYASFMGTTFGGGNLVMMFQEDESGYCRITSIQIDGENYMLFLVELLEMMYENIEED